MKTIPNAIEYCVLFFVGDSLKDSKKFYNLINYVSYNSYLI